jgi:hypothetical protein
MKAVENEVPKVTEVTTKRTMPHLNWGSKAEINPVEQIPTESIMKVPISEIKPVTKAPTGISHDLARALNDFSKLPLWLTMPMLFALSFVLGAIVSFLIK